MNQCHVGWPVFHTESRQPGLRLFSKIRGRAQGLGGGGRSCRGAFKKTRDRQIVDQMTKGLAVAGVAAAGGQKKRIFSLGIEALMQ